MLGIEKNDRPHFHPRRHSQSSLSHAYSKHKLLLSLAKKARGSFLKLLAIRRREGASFIKNDHSHLMMLQIFLNASTNRIPEFEKGIKTRN